jgi:hypothetical protein
MLNQIHERMVDLLSNLHIETRGFENGSFTASAHACDITDVSGAPVPSDAQPVKVQRKMGGARRKRQEPCDPGFQDKVFDRLPKDGEA